MFGMSLPRAIRFFAGAGRPQLLDVLLSHPRRRFSINELARRAKVPVATTWRAVRDFADLGLILTEPVGRTTLVQLNGHSPVTRALGQLQFPDPHRMAYEAFARRLAARLPGIQPRLFGSLAKGEVSPSSDVDVIVPYEGSGYSKKEVQDACAKVGVEILDDFRIVVSPLIVPRPAVIA
jgi:nucleotidyltransferase-like protein